MNRILTAIFAIALLGGCATPPEDIQAQSVSHHQYSSLDCDALILEAKKVDARGSDIYNILHEKASTDTGQVAIGLLLFWPALLLVEGGDGAEAAEYGRLQGEWRELTAEATRKNCDMSSLPTEPFPERMEKEHREKQRRYRDTAGKNDN